MFNIRIGIFSVCLINLSQSFSSGPSLPSQAIQSSGSIVLGQLYFECAS